MSLQNDLENLSRLTDKQLNDHIASLQYVLRYMSISPEPSTPEGWRFIKAQLQSAEEELERRFLLS